MTIKQLKELLDTVPQNRLECEIEVFDPDTSEVLEVNDIFHPADDEVENFKPGDHGTSSEAFIIIAERKEY